VRILVIDDDAVILDVLSEMLTDAGYEVVAASNGNEGVRLYRERPFDLVVTDMIMPEKDGLEVVMELRRDFPDVKVLTLSGGGDYGYGYSSLEAARALGAAATLRKPFEESQLLAAVRDVLESRRGG
jgi:CheY-like chemotaxis protein